MGPVAPHTGRRDRRVFFTSRPLGMMMSGPHRQPHDSSASGKYPPDAAAWAARELSRGRWLVGLMLGCCLAAPTGNTGAQAPGEPPEARQRREEAEKYLR